MNGMEPRFYALRPRGDREGGPAQAVAVAALGVHVKLRGDFRVLEHEEIDYGVFDVDGVVFGLHEEGGRGAGGDLDVGVGSEVFVGEGEVTGIDDDGEIGTA